MARKPRPPRPDNPFRWFDSSPEVIRLVVMMYVKYPLSLRNVEDLLHERGIDICHETVRHWWNRFGPMFAAEIRRKRVDRMRAHTHWRWHLDEVYVKINGGMHCLWRAVDHEGEVLESFASEERDTMRFVPVKSAERQSVLVLHRTRELLVRQRTMLINAIRGHCAEFGLVVAQGARRAVELIEQVRSADPSVLPDLARQTLLTLADQLAGLAAQINGLERRLLLWHRHQASQRLATIPGVGIITATALAASVPEPGLFRSGREFAAFLGLVPRQNSSGGKDRLGRISKMGDGYLRKLLVVGATSVIRRAKTDALAAAPWIRLLLERRPARVVTVAMANKTARIAWAVLARGDVYRAPALAA